MVDRLLCQMHSRILFLRSVQTELIKGQTTIVVNGGNRHKVLSLEAIIALICS